VGCLAAVVKSFKKLCGAIATITNGSRIELASATTYGRMTKELLIPNALRMMADFSCFPMIMGSIRAPPKILLATRVSPTAPPGRWLYKSYITWPGLGSCIIFSVHHLGVQLAGVEASHDAGVGVIRLSQSSWSFNGAVPPSGSNQTVLRFISKPMIPYKCDLGLVIIGSKLFLHCASV
jgi:hypothetical protein